MRSFGPHSLVLLTLTLLFGSASYADTQAEIRRDALTRRFFNGRVGISYDSKFVMKSDGRNAWRRMTWGTRDPEEVQRKLHDVLGREPTRTELAGLAGALDGGKVIVRQDAKGNGVWLVMSHPELARASQLHIYRDADQKLVLGNELIAIDNGVGSKRSLPHGIGARIFSHQVAAAERLAMDRIELHAAGGKSGSMRWAGAMVWPKYGFDGALPSSVDSFWFKLRLGAVPGNARTIQELLGSEEGRSYWTNMFAKFARSPTMKFDLKPDSASQAMWSQYAASHQISTYLDALRKFDRLRDTHR